MTVMKFIYIYIYIYIYIFIYLYFIFNNLFFIFIDFYIKFCYIIINLLHDCHEIFLYFYEINMF